MISVPTWVAGQLGLQDSYVDEAALRFGLSSFDGHEALPRVGPDDLLDALVAPRFQKVGLLAIEQHSPWRFARLSIGGADECVLVELADQIDAAAPSAAIRTLVRAWLLDDSFRPDRLLAAYSDSVLIGWETQHPSSLVTERFCASLAGIRIPERITSQPLACRSATDIIVPANALALREARVYEGIVQSAVQSSSPSLRFLYLYRLFERAYLIDALEKLQGSFFDDPKRSIKVAESAVANERASFIALVEGSPAESIFTDIEALFVVAQSNNSNRFMIALAKAASDDRDLDFKEPWKRGCVLAYKMRCAIVHSGKAGPIFESYADAIDACELVNEKLEAAAFSLLGIGFS